MEVSEDCLWTRGQLLSAGAEFHFSLPYQMPTHGEGYTAAQDSFPPSLEPVAKMNLCKPLSVTLFL